MNADFQDNKKFYSILKCTLNREHRLSRLAGRATLNLLSKENDLRLPARLCLAWQAGLRKSASH